MEQPYITWYAKTNEDHFVATDNYYAGTYTKEKMLSVNIQVWNNRWGVADVQSLVNPVIKMHFDTLEDSSLLLCCRIIVGQYDQATLIIKDNKASAVLNGITLSGRGNNGSESDSTDNFVNLTFEFSAENYTLKENDLKNLYFEITTLK